MVLRRIVSLLVLPGGLLGCSAEEPASGATVEAAASMEPRVRVREPSRCQPEPRARIAGTIESRSRVELGFPWPGVLDSVAVEVGDRVMAGEQLARLRSKELAARLRVAKANLDAAREGRDQSQRELERLQKLAASNTIGHAEVERLESSVRAAGAAVKLGKGEVEAAAATLVQTELRAPAEAIVTAVTGRAGEPTGPGPVIVLEPVDPDLRLRARIPEHLVGQIAVGDSLEGRLIAQDRSVSAQVQWIGAVESSPGTHRYELTATFELADGEVLPGFAVELALGSDEPEGSCVPLSAVVREGPERTGVFVLGPAEDGGASAAFRAVELGSWRGDEVEIVDGLAPGDRIVVDGAQELRDGLQVRVYEEDTAP